VQDVITVDAGDINFESATGSCGLDQPDPDAKTFVSGATEGCSLNQPDPDGTNFLSQGGTTTVE
jgi:hypothetical protein